jgi:hypothetical protein
MKARTLFPILALAALFLLPACRGYPTVRIKYDRPPLQKIPDKVKRVATIVELDPHAYVNEMGIHERIQNKIENALLQSQYYQIVNRTRLDVVLAEQKLSRSELVNAGDEIQVKFQIADAFILGKVTKAFYESKRGPIQVVVRERRMVKQPPKRVISHHDDKGNPVYVSQKQPDRAVWEDVVRTMRRGTYWVAGFAISFRMIDAKSGGIYASWEFNRDYDTRTARTFHGRAVAIHPDELVPARLSQTLDGFVNIAVQEFLKQVAPYKVEENVILIPRSEFSQKGIQFATNGMIAEAIGQFDQAARVEVPNDGALYNKGVMLEAMGQYQEAYALYKQAHTMTGEALYLAAMKRMHKELQIQDEQ